MLSIFIKETNTVARLYCIVTLLNCVTYHGEVNNHFPHTQKLKIMGSIYILNYNILH